MLGAASMAEEKQTRELRQNGVLTHDCFFCLSWWDARVELVDERAFHWFTVQSLRFDSSA
jgi:hypothetical protein